MSGGYDKTVRVTGDAGYVGSYCCKAFARNGWRVVCLDNLSRGRREMVKWGPLIVADIADSGAVRATIDEHRPDVIGHFAAFAYVGESVEAPNLITTTTFRATSRYFRRLARRARSGSCSPAPATPRVTRSATRSMKRIRNGQSTLLAGRS